MSFNLLQLLEQLKKFMQQENGSWFTLFLYVLGGLMIGDRVLERMLKYGFPQTPAYGVACLIIVSFISIWFLTRDVKIKKGKINIGIADLTIIHISETTQLNYEQKVQLATESSQYLYNQIQDVIFDGTSIKQINLIKLPSRVQVSFENDKDVAEDLKVDILVRGALKYVNEKYYLDYKITCCKKVESWAFMQIIQIINSAQDIPFDFQDNSKKIENFAQNLLCLGLLLHATQDIASHKFLSALSTLQPVIDRIEGLPARKKKNELHYLILYLYRFCCMRNLIMMKEWINKEKLTTANTEEQNPSNERIQSSIHDNFMQLIKCLKSYFLTATEELQDNEQFCLEFLYALSVDPYRDWHDDAIFVYKEGAMLPGIQELLSGYFSLIEDNLIDAKLTYQNVLTQDHDNMVALRSLGIIEYGLGDFQLAKQYLEDYQKNNTQHIFFRHYKDTRVLKLLSASSLRIFHLVDAIKYYGKYCAARYENRRLRKRYIIL